MGARLKKQRFNGTCHVSRENMITHVHCKLPLALQSCVLNINKRNPYSHTYIRCLPKKQHCDVQKRMISPIPHQAQMNFNYIALKLVVSISFAHNTLIISMSTLFPTFYLQIDYTISCTIHVAICSDPLSCPETHHIENQKMVVEYFVSLLIGEYDHKIR